MFSLSRCLAQTSNRCCNSKSFCFIFLLSMQIHGGVFLVFLFWLFCFVLFFFYCCWGFFVLLWFFWLGFLLLLFCPFIFLDIWCKPAENSNKYKLKCKKICEFIGNMKLRTIQTNFSCYQLFFERKCSLNAVWLATFILEAMETCF